MPLRRGVGPWVFALVIIGLICMYMPAVWGGKAAARKSRMSNDLLDLMNYTAVELSVAQADGSWPAEAPPIGSDRRVIVDVYVVSQDEVPETMVQLEALGFEVTGQMNTVISGWIPIDSLPSVENIPQVQNCIGSNRAAHAGRIMSEGDKAMQTDKIRAQLGLTGKGITIAVLSDSYNVKGGAAADIASGDLPSDIEVVADWTGSASDEGRAMLQLIHDCAPEAKLTFHHVWGGIAQFAQGIQNVAGCPPGSSSSCKPAKRPAQVIVDDVIYFGEPFFQDGLVAQAVDLVTKAGIVYVSAAGNYARQAWEGNARLTGQRLPAGKWANFQGGYMHDFSGSGTYYQRIKTPANGQMWFTFQWQQPFVSAGGKGTSSDWDAYLFEDTNNDGTPDTVVKWATIQNERGDAVEYLGHKNPYNAERIFYLALVLDVGTPTATDRLKWINTGVGVPIDFITNSPTLFGHANAETAIAVAAASARQTPQYGYNPAVPEGFTALGATRIFFDTKGGPLNLVRSHPDLTGPDGTLNTFFGGYTRFYGTSAAAPHISAVVACMLQAKPCLTPAQVRQILRDTAIEMKDPQDPNAVGFDWLTGAGFVNALEASNRAKAMLCSSCPLIFMWKNMPDAASTAENLVVNVLVSCAAALGTGYTIAWSADIFTLTSAMGSNTGKLTVPKATLAPKAGSKVKLTVKITKGSTVVTDIVTITLGAPPQLCSGCATSAAFKLANIGAPLTFGSTFSVSTIKAGITGAAQFSVGILSQGVYMPLTDRRGWDSVTVSNLLVPVPNPCFANISKNMAFGAGQVAITLAVYSSLDIPNYVTMYINTKAGTAQNVNTLAQAAVNAKNYANAAQLLSLCSGPSMTVAREETLRLLLTNLRLGYDTDAIAHAAFQVVTSSDVSTAVAGELFSLIAELSAKPLSIDAARDAIEALVDVVDAAQLTGASSKFETEAVASYIIQTGLRHIDDVLKATLLHAASLPNTNLTAVGIGVPSSRASCKAAPAAATCRFYADINVLRTDQVLATNWWTNINGLSMTADKNLVGAGVAPANGLFVSYISWTQNTPLDKARTDGTLGLQTGMAKLQFANIAMSGERAQVASTMTVGATGNPIVRLSVAPTTTSVVSALSSYVCLNRGVGDASWTVAPNYIVPINVGGQAACQLVTVTNKYVAVGKKTGSTTNVDEDGNPIITPDGKEKTSSSFVLGVVGMLVVGSVLVAGTAFLLARWRRGRASESDNAWPKHEELEPSEDIDAGVALHEERAVDAWGTHVMLQPSSPLSPASESSARQSAALGEK